MSDPAGQDIQVRGTLHAVDGRGVVRVETTVASTVDEVWAAATTPEGLAGWAGAVTGDLRVGGEYHAVLFPSGWDGTGSVLECEPGRRFLVESAEPGGPRSTDELVVTPDASGSTRVVLTKRRASLDFLAAYGVGTQIHLENLAAHLAGRGPVDPDPFWAVLLPQYEQLAAEL